MKQKIEGGKKIKISQVVDDSLAKGWKMSKKISSGGFFTNPTYDHRTVYNRDALWKLTNEGFLLDEDTGSLSLNILLKL